ncbi:MAG: hypothetical protein Unbinned3138contig1000_25 [Prokaryotic dsDNA virus sp.]|mgnify:CR=1 FL=1|nr:MAG: hypothetical protein Unbinned3138contig1000_25 [Prokaryotic dsDNA virus sp.]|tara:strand:- start:5809 stop:6063 length:255 start_codon:yes stop_codon:yes gene_type:complete
MDLTVIFTALTETIGPLGAIVIVALAWGYVQERRRNNDLQDKRLEDWREHADATNNLSREIVEVTSGVKVALERAIQEAYGRGR